MILIERSKDSIIINKFMLISSNKTNHTLQN